MSNAAAWTIVVLLGLIVLLQLGHEYTAEVRRDNCAMHLGELAADPATPYTSLPNCG